MLICLIALLVAQIIIDLWQEKKVEIVKKFIHLNQLFVH